VAALLTPRPPALLVLNEPETSLHPDLIPALADLILTAAKHSQIIAVTHSLALNNALAASAQSQRIALNTVELEKDFGETKISGQEMLDEPLWYWPKRNR
jgi:predicted ATPase